MKLSRYGMGLAALVGAMGLVEPHPTQARTHAQVIHGRATGNASVNQVLKDERLCNMLLNKLDGSIVHQNKAIATQDSLIAKEEAILAIVPTTQKQAQQLQRQFNQLGIRINHLQSDLNLGKIRVTNQESNVNNCLNLLSRLNVTNARLAQQLANYLQQAFARAAVQAVEVEQIVNRPAATPFVPF